MKTFVDFHSHILPGIDDGSACVEESVAMLQREAEQGITHVIATPHFYANYDNPERFLRRRADAEALLRGQMARCSGMPQLSIGAEVHYFHGISDSDVLSELTIDQKRCILIEMPCSVWTDGMYRELAQIYSKQGITPIIAHIDRYLSPFRTYGIPDRLEQLPVLIQANASFFLHSSTKRMALRMLKRNRIHLLGSDCHNLTDRAPNLGAAIETIKQCLGQEIIDWIELKQNEALFEK